VTGLHNRRCFEETLRVEWRRATRDKKPVSLILCSIDEMEAYEEAQGTQATETLLKRVAKVVRGFGRRAGDLSARFSESRYALLLAGCDTRNAFRIAEALRERVEELKLPHEKSRIGEFVTVHLGVATMVPARNADERMLIDRVEAAVYEASFQGGNRTVLYRALDKLRIEHWNMKVDGPLNEQALLQKIMIWGYDTQRGVHPAGTRFPDRNHESEVVLGVLTGQLKVTVEGQSLVLKHGDCLFIPAGITYSTEVVGQDPVISFGAVNQK
jgi:diguanylate cyclase (GGDEF)-like protein